MKQVDIIQILTKGGLSSAGIGLLCQGLLFVNIDTKLVPGMILIAAGIFCLVLREFFKHLNKETTDDTTCTTTPTPPVSHND